MKTFAAGSLPAARRQSEQVHQRHRVVRRADLRVVVEVDVDVAPRAAPAPELGGPGAQRLRRVAARVQLLVAVQARVDEVRGGLLEIGPFAGRVGDDERDPGPPQQGNEPRVAVRRVTDLEGVKQGPVRPGLELAALVDHGVVPSGEARGGPRVPRQPVEEGLQEIPIEAEARRKLPEDRTQFRAEAEEAVGEKISERRLHVPQTLDVRDEARSLDGEHEVLRRLVAPRGVRLRALERVEGPVDLERAETARRVLELPRMGQLRRVEGPAPAVVGPARYADEDLSGHGHADSLARGRRAEEQRFVEQRV
jgi:hypothetical protein